MESEHENSTEVRSSSNPVGSYTNAYDENGNGMKVFAKGGRLYPPFQTIAKQLVWAKQMQFRPDDVVLISYPKTGCHWTHELLEMLVRGTTDTPDATKITGMIELQESDSAPSPRLLNTHLLPDELSCSLWQAQPKVILVVRNFKDTVVSFYHHHAGMIQYDYNGLFDAYLNGHLKEGFDCGSYFDFYKAWWPELKRLRHVLCVTYEDLKNDAMRSMQRLNDFMQTARDDEFLRDAIHASRIDHMRLNKRADFLWKDQYKSTGFFRKGLAGDWINFFTVAQNERADARLQTFFNTVEPDFVQLCSKFRFT